MPNKTVVIDVETARFYLNLEAMFITLATSLHLDPDVYLEIDPNKRYQHHCDLADNLSQAVHKPEYQVRASKRRHLRGEPF